MPVLSTNEAIEQLAKGVERAKPAALAERGVLALDLHRRHDSVPLRPRQPGYLCRHSTILLAQPVSEQPLHPFTSAAIPRELMRH
jgi:hypothetical protein